MGACQHFQNPLNPGPILRALGWRWTRVDETHRAAASAVPRLSDGTLVSNARGRWVPDRASPIVAEIDSFANYGPDFTHRSATINPRPYAAHFDNPATDHSSELRAKTDADGNEIAKVL